MTYISDKSFQIEVSKGNVPGHAIVQRSGVNNSVGTTFAPVCRGGFYRMPQTGSAANLRIKSGGNANDTAAGTGAREITLVGLDTSGNEQTATLSTLGGAASVATISTWIRLYKAYVSASGTYATASTGSQAASITIEDSGGTQDWATIHYSGYGRGESEIGFYTIPSGKTGYVISNVAFTDSTKTTDLILFQRGSILDTSAPYDAMRSVHEITVKGGESTITADFPFGPFAGPCDIGYMAKVDTGTAVVEVDFEVLLVDN